MLKSFLDSFEAASTGTITRKNTAQNWPLLLKSYFGGWRVSDKDVGVRNCGVELLTMVNVFVCLQYLDMKIAPGG